MNSSRWTARSQSTLFMISSQPRDITNAFTSTLELGTCYHELGKMCLATMVGKIANADGSEGCDLAQMGTRASDNDYYRRR